VVGARVVVVGARVVVVGTRVLTVVLLVSVAVRVVEAVDAVTDVVVDVGVVAFAFLLLLPKEPMMVRTTNTPMTTHTRVRLRNGRLAPPAGVESVICCTSRRTRHP